MTTAITTLPQRKTDLPPKNRVVGFEGVTGSCAGFFASQVIGTHQEISTTSTTIVSGVFEWLSNDPIGISGGLNQYVFCDGNPVNARDPWGLNPHPNAANMFLRSLMTRSPQFIDPASSLGRRIIADSPTGSVDINWHVRKYLSSMRNKECDGGETDFSFEFYGEPLRFDSYDSDHGSFLSILKGTFGNGAESISYSVGQAQVHYRASVSGKVLADGSFVFDAKVKYLFIDDYNFEEFPLKYIPGYRSSLTWSGLVSGGGRRVK